ncbi:hypothetical protein [Rhabdothermincola salaria]|uniref:hypothetical protein n=1 Tax=Rhabdothermincola salaria TaxID=2903142 RepID=UPI001E60EE2B|nr:hypothetical protein [Rhabdothermincola salaria]MCD9623586.1 hypothetical protein [Rhabdothermincola salaria]
MSEQDLIDRAQAVVGDGDTIVAAAWFQPRGTSGGVTGGSAVGTSLGNIAGDGLFGAALGLAGGAAGYAAEKHHDGHVVSETGGEVRIVPWESLVAASKTRLYGWRIKPHVGRREPGEQLFAYDRDRIAVTVHSRVGVRTFELEDQDTGVRWEFESPRIAGHLKFLLDALHPDTEPAGA